MQTIAEFIAKHGITMTATRVDHKPHTDADEGSRDASHWQCTFLLPEQPIMVVYFSMGSALTGPPTAEDVLDTLAMDATHETQDFEEWCGECGYSTDSRKAERIWKAVLRQTEKLLAFLGEEAFNELVYETERL